MNIDPGTAAAQAFELGGEYYVDFIPCGVPERRFINDGIDPLAVDIVLTNREGTIRVNAKYDGATYLLDVMIDGVVRMGSPYNSEWLTNAGYTHWMYPEA
jgi:hypothetical protein